MDDVLYEYYCETYESNSKCISQDRHVLYRSMTRIIEINTKLKALYKRFNECFEFEDFYFYYKDTNALYIDREFELDIIRSAIYSLNMLCEWNDSIYKKLHES